MAVLFSDKPLSVVQRRVNWVALLLLGLLGIALGLKMAQECALITSGYAATYNYPVVLFITLLFLLLGLLLLVYWRTRWVGCALMLAGVLNVVAFVGGMRILLMENRVAWRHPQQMVSIGPDQRFSAVIYFKKDVNNRQVEDFRTSVLMEPATPRHDGRDFPVFVRQYLHLSPTQANGREAIALMFSVDTPPDRREAYLAAIKSDNRIDTVFLNSSPASIHADSKNP
jgi:hypothetical protein